MNKHVESATQDYNKHLFDVEEGHIVRVNLVWSREDVAGTAENMGVELTEDEVDEVLHCLILKHNPETGVTWDTIEFWIDEVVREREENK